MAAQYGPLDTPAQIREKRLAGIALKDTEKAKAQLEALGLALDAPADKTHVGGSAKMGDKEYVIQTDKSEL